MSAKEAREAMEAIEREARAKAKAETAAKAKAGAGKKVSDKFLEDEMEKALNEENTHLGEFAVMTGLRQKNEGAGDGILKRERLMSPEAEVPGKSVAPEVADAAVQLLRSLIGDARGLRKFACRSQGTARLRGPLTASTSPPRTPTRRPIRRGSDPAGASRPRTRPSSISWSPPGASIRAPSRGLKSLRSTTWTTCWQRPCR